MSYLKDLKLILTLQVNQFLINMEKRIFALLRGYWLCRQKRLRQKLFELAVCDQFQSSHRSLSNVIVVLILVQTSNILQGKWYRLSNTISQFGTETILSANVPQYLSIFPVFIRFFFWGGGGGVEKRIERGETATGLIFSPVAMATIQWIYMAAIFDVPYWN